MIWIITLDKKSYQGLFKEYCLRICHLRQSTIKNICFCGAVLDTRHWIRFCKNKMILYYLALFSYSTLSPDILFLLDHTTVFILLSILRLVFFKLRFYCDWFRIGPIMGPRSALLTRRPVIWVIAQFHLLAHYFSY